MESPPQDKSKFEEKTFVDEPADIQIKQDQQGNIEVNIENKWNWWPSWTPSFTWKPTSEELLRDTEAKILKAATGIEFEQTMIKAGDHAINTVIVGNGPPLVLLHGFGAGVGFWVGNLKELAQKHKVYAIDLPGFGRSSRVPFSGKTPEEAEEYFLFALESWRKEAKLDAPFILLGHSFGGYLAATYSLKHPENVAHLILADPWGVPERPPEVQSNKVPLRWKLVRGIANTLNPLSVIRIAGPYGPGLIAKFRKDIEMKFQHIYEDTSVVSQYIYHLNAQNPSGETAFGTLNASLGWAKNPLVGRLPNLDPAIRITFLYGSYTWMDRQVGHSLSEQLGQRADYHIIPQSGHHIYIDNWSFFNERVLDSIQIMNHSFSH